MFDKASKKIPRKYHFSFYGMTFLFEPRSIYDWLALLIMAFGAFLLAFHSLGLFQSRSEMTVWSHSPPTQHRRGEAPGHNAPEAEVKSRKSLVAEVQRSNAESKKDLEVRTLEGEVKLGISGKAIVDQLAQ